MFWVGCSTNATVSPTYLFIDSTKSITLYLLDDQQVSFSAGNYSATDAGDSCYVSGSGVVSKKGSRQQEQFSGTINFRQVREMKYSDPAPTNSLTPLLVAGSLIMVFIVFFTTKAFKT